MKKLLFYVSFIIYPAQIQTQITLCNKSAEQIFVAVNVHAKQTCDKILIKPRQSKKFPVPAVTEMQPLYLTVSSKAAYWPATFEMQRNADQFILKRDSLIVSRKNVKKTARRRLQNHETRHKRTSIIKIAYYGTCAQQEIGFMETGA